MLGRIVDQGSRGPEGSWSSAIAVKVGESAYLVSTKFLAEKPQLTDAQLEEVARTMVERLQQ